MQIFFFPFSGDESTLGSVVSCSIQHLSHNRLSPHSRTSYPLVLNIVYPQPVASCRHTGRTNLQVFTSFKFFQQRNLSHMDISTIVDGVRYLYVQQRVYQSTCNELTHSVLGTIIPKRIAIVSTYTSNFEPNVCFTVISELSAPSMFHTECWERIL